MQDKVVMAIDLDQKDLVMINGHKKTGSAGFFQSKTNGLRHDQAISNQAQPEKSKRQNNMREFFNQQFIKFFQHNVYRLM